LSFAEPIAVGSARLVLPEALEVFAWGRRKIVFTSLPKLARERLCCLLMGINVTRNTP
jgi:hypothetical protein